MYSYEQKDINLIMLNMHINIIYLLCDLYIKKKNKEEEEEEKHKA